MDARPLLSSRASVPPAVPAIWRSSPFWNVHMKRKHPSLRQQLNALAREADRAEGEMIRRRQALSPEKRTHFLRRRVGLRATAR